MAQTRLVMTGSRLRFCALWLVILAGVPVPAGADELSDDPGLDPDAFGLEFNMDYISAEEFVCSDTDGTCDYRRNDTKHVWCTAGSVRDVFAAVEIPAGALITGMNVFYWDDEVGQDLMVSLRRNSWHWNSGESDVEIKTWYSTGTPGYGRVVVDVNPDVVVERRYRVYPDVYYNYQSYYIVATVGWKRGLRGVAILWKRQVSPAPVNATFADVPIDYWAFQHVEALVASGITSGCGGGSFCPESPVTRAQMAVFLAKALGLHWSY